MATRIQIRRDSGANWSSANPVLASGELGINLTTGQFKIGDGSTAWNSLSYFVGYLAGGNLNDLSDVTITSAANGDFLRWNGTAWVNDAVNLATDTIGDYVQNLVAGTGVVITNNSGEASTPTIAIEQAVGISSSVTFASVHAPLIGNASTASQLETTRIINLGGDLSGSASFNGSSDVTINASVNPNSVSLGSDTTGDFVQNLVAGTGVVITNNSGEGSTPTVAIGQAVNTSSSVTFAHVSAPVTGSVTGNASTASALESTRTISLGGDLSGSASFNGTTDIVITASVEPNSVNLGTDTVGDYMLDVIAGTGISVSHTPSEGSSASVSLNATLNDLNDVVVGTPEQHQTLAYDGIGWVPTYSPTVSYVRNAESTTLTTGTVVYLFGGTGDHASVKRADNGSDATSSKTVGVVAANIAANENGPVVTRGYVSGMNLSSYSVGDVLWLSTTGAFTTTKPTSPNHLVFVGVVVRATNNGIMYVATQNGYEIDELHDVSITSKTSGDFLKYNGSLWVNDQINLGTDTVGDYMLDIVAGTGITISHTTGEGSTASVSVNTGTIATVAYVDSVAAGINWHEAVKYTTTTHLPDSPTYNNGTNGVGATLTAGSNGRLVVDSQNATTGDRILVKNQTTNTQNGIYVVTEQGSASAAYILTRASDTDNSIAGQVKAGDAVFVSAGTVNANQGFVLTSQGSGTAGAHVLGTDSITYTQFTGTANIIAGSGLTKTGNSMDVVGNAGRIVVNDDNVDLATVSQTNTTGTAGVSFVQSHSVDSYGRVTGTVTADVRDATTSDKGIASFSSDSFAVASGQVTVKANGISNAQLANSSITVAGNTVSLGGTTGIAANDLSDVTITSAAVGDVITYNGSAWINQQPMPSGAITQFAGSSAPTGWLVCDGSAVSRTTYAALFAVIGSTYGDGNGSTTFNLPNLKGRVPVGLDSAQTEFDALGETGGAKTHTLTTAEMPSHTHTQNAHNHTGSALSAGSHQHGYIEPYNTSGMGPAGSYGYYHYARSALTDSAGAHTHTLSIDNATATNQNTGGGGAHNNLQPYIVLNYIIKA